MTYYGKDVEEYLNAATSPGPDREAGFRAITGNSTGSIISDYMAERVNLKPGTAKVVSTYLVMLSRDLPAPLSEVDTKMMLQYIGRANEKLKQNSRHRYYPLFKNVHSLVDL